MVGTLHGTQSVPLSGGTINDHFFANFLLNASVENFENRKKTLWLNFFDSQSINWYLSIHGD